MKEVDDFFGEREEVFKDCSYFSPTYLPSSFKYREKEFDEIGMTFKSFYDGAPCQTYLSGPPGTGKSHIVNCLIEGFNEAVKRRASPCRYIYINCRQKTYPTLLNLVLLCFDEKGRGIGQHTSVILNKIQSWMKNLDIGVYFIFDEVDRLIPSKGHWKPFEELIGAFSRFSDEGCKKNVGVMIIANAPDLLERVSDDSAKSSFCPTRIQFRDYAINQIEDILWDRVSRGFVENTVDRNTISEFALIIKNGNHDLRHALKVLLDAGNLAKKRTDRRIFKNDLLLSVTRVEKEETEELIRGLSEIEQMLLWVIAELQVKKQIDGDADACVTSDEIWKNLQKSAKKLKIKLPTPRHINEYVLPRLEAQGLFTTGKKGLGKGKSWVKIFRMGEEVAEIHEVLCELMGDVVVPRINSIKTTQASL